MEIISLLLSLSFALLTYSQSNPRATSYNETDAKMFLNLAAAAYGDSPQGCIEASFPSGNYAIVSQGSEKCDKISSICSGYVIKSDVDKQIIVVYRGTKTETQLLYEGWTTLNPEKDFYDMGKVNSYFKHAHETLWPDVQNTITNDLYKDYKIAFTGHSLGAAIACLAAAETVHQGHRSSSQVHIITFGEPRVGNSQFARSFDLMIPDSFRVVFRRDIVPHLPGCVKDISDDQEGRASRPCDPNNLDRGYHHGTEIWYPSCMDSGCEYRECTGSPKDEDFSCSDQYKFELKNGAQYIWDHRHYFAVKVTSFGKVGCNNASVDYSNDSPNSGSLNKVFKGVGWLGGKLGITK